jgi:uncharacterized membrane protein
MATYSDHSDHTKLTPARMEAFSDAVMAIIITLTVLEIKIPTGAGLDSLVLLVPSFLVYVVSFFTIGTYWNNHHHLLRATKHISAGIMWANLYLLFWLSLIPVVTTWLGEHWQSYWPTALYAAVLLMVAVAYNLLELQIVQHTEKREDLFRELTEKPKGLISMAVYVLAVIAAFYYPIISDGLIILVALMWFIPDRRIEKYIHQVS